MHGGYAASVRLRQPGFTAALAIERHRNPPRRLPKICARTRNSLTKSPAASTRRTTSGDGAWVWSVVSVTGVPLRMLAGTRTSACRKAPGRGNGGGKMGIWTPGS